jgi:hypothetical protein
VNEIEHLIAERKAAKQRREFARADEIRRSLADRGILLEDTPAGTRWKREMTGPSLKTTSRDRRRRRSSSATRASCRPRTRATIRW